MIGDNIQKTLKIVSEFSNIGMSDDYSLEYCKTELVFQMLEVKEVSMWYG